MPPPATRLLIDPPMSRWRPATARRVEGSFLAATDGRPIIATGHQLRHWHPGILAKYLAAEAYAKASGGSVLNVWVNHDAVDALTVDLPIRDGDRLSIHSLQLGSCDATLPTWGQPAIDAKAAAAKLREATVLPLAGGVRLDALIEAWEHAPPKTFLDNQVAAVLDRLQAFDPDAPRPFMATDLWRWRSALETLTRILHEARDCVRLYNEAVARHPQTGMRPLLVEPHRVEVPLWALAEGQPRHRVYADLSDARPILTLESGEPVDWEDQLEYGNEEPIAWPLAPRALLLTALMRAYFCDLFIHGTGGGAYDRVMEEWWQAWIGEPLAPMAVVSADVYLPFEGVPISQREDWEKAVWYAHHLPHNLDRHMPMRESDAPLVLRKRELLSHMDDDRDAARRKASFKAIHEINHALTDSHRDAIDASRRDVEMAKIGLENRRIAMRRDWSFTLYPPALIDDLARRIEQSIPSRL